MGFDEIKARILDAEKKCDKIGKTNLIAVSKLQPNERVEAVLNAGHRVFGENKVQEAHSKWPAFKQQFEGVELHLLGPLQTNKVKSAIALFDVIHSLDREKLAKKIASEIQEQNRDIGLFIQVNTGEEPQKAGIIPSELDDFVSFCKELSLNILGLMAIPPINEEASLHFALLAKLAKAHHFKRLSMGMSADFETAIAFGASDIRIGSALFGERSSLKK